MHTRTKAPRRRHADELKARVLAACAEPGASVAAVAQAPPLCCVFQPIVDGISG